MSYSTLINGARVRFATHAPAILGSRFDDMTVTGTITFSIATRFDDVVVKHNTVYSSLPSGTPQDAKDLTFVVFLNNVTGKEVVFATAWIDENSIEGLDNTGLTFRIPHAAIGDQDRIRSALLEMGFPTIEFIAN